MLHPHPFGLHPLCLILQPLSLKSPGLCLSSILRSIGGQRVSQSLGICCSKFGGLPLLGSKPFHVGIRLGLLRSGGNLSQNEAPPPFTVRESARPLYAAALQAATLRIENRRFSMAANIEIRRISIAAKSAERNNFENNN
jgi:hypothetical protein